MPDNALMHTPLQRLGYWLALLGCGLLIGLGLLWEISLAPLRPQGSLLALKVMPLLWLMLGMLRGEKKKFQWLSLVIWLYALEGLVRLGSDHNAMSRSLALVEWLLACVTFAGAALLLRKTKPLPNLPHRPSS